MLKSVRSTVRRFWIVSGMLALTGMLSASCSSSDTGSSGGTGGGTSTGPGSGCRANYTECGSLCCAPGKICSSPGQCDFPYNTADLYVYLCPSFNTGNCTAAYLSIDQTCTPLHNPMPGTCYNTGFKVAGGQSYGLSTCTGCAMGCGNPISLTTPEGFTKPNYYSGVSFHCNTPCTPPPECGQAANAGGPGTTATGAGGASGTGAGGAVGTGTAGSSGDIGLPCTTSAHPAWQDGECTASTSCKFCSVRSCVRATSQGCCAGEDTPSEFFPCGGCQNCTDAVTAALTRCGCI
jgi:hypothetical protein